MDFTYKQAKQLLEFFGEPDPDNQELEITVIEDGGLYAFYTEYPEEGAMKLDRT